MLPWRMCVVPSNRISRLPSHIQARKDAMNSPQILATGSIHTTGPGVLALRDPAVSTQLTDALPTLESLTTCSRHSFKERSSPDLAPDPVRRRTGTGDGRRRGIWWRRLIDARARGPAFRSNDGGRQDSILAHTRL